MMLSCPLLCLALPVVVAAQESQASPVGAAGSLSAVYQRWENGLPSDPGCFPIAVWLQAPANAGRYREAGINLYVGLWRGPTDDQLRELKEAGMLTICAQNELALRSEYADVVVGWMHDDEPDNAQPLRNSDGYGPPIPPSEIQLQYERMLRRDDARPVLLNLGQGVAFDQYIGRGVRRNHPEDYPEYVKGCDIASFDIYPAVHRNEAVAGKLEFVARGVERLRRWTSDEQIVWNCIECSRIGNVDVKPKPVQIRAEVWMSLIHGSRGIIYFVHQFEPTFKEASLLDDAELLPAVTAINEQIRELAPVLNGPSIDGAIRMESDRGDAQIASMCKRRGRSLYVLTVNMQNQRSSATVELVEPNGAQQVQVLGENRAISIHDGRFADDYAPYAVHLYRIELAQ